MCSSGGMCCEVHKGHAGMQEVACAQSLWGGQHTVHSATRCTHTNALPHTSTICITYTHTSSCMDLHFLYCGFDIMLPPTGPLSPLFSPPPLLPHAMRDAHMGGGTTPLHAHGLPKNTRSRGAPAQRGGGFGMKREGRGMPGQHLIFFLTSSFPYTMGVYTCAHISQTNIHIHITSTKHTHTCTHTHTYTYTHTRTYKHQYITHLEHVEHHIPHGVDVFIPC